METPHQLADDALIIAMVESGQGISVIPELVLDYLGGDIRVFPIESAPFRHHRYRYTAQRVCDPRDEDLCADGAGLCGAAISRRAALLPLSAAEN